MKRPTLDQLRAYLRANESDMERPDWEVILEICEEVVAHAFIDLELWKDDPTDPRPSLQEVLDESLCTDFLVFADDQQKKQIEDWVTVRALLSMPIFGATYTEDERIVLDMINRGPMGISMNLLPSLFSAAENLVREGVIRRVTKGLDRSEKWIYEGVE